IIFTRKDGRIHFIDLYRSREKDYVQDVSVFLVSNFRMPVFDREVRRRLGMVIDDFRAFASAFAEGAGDGTFAARVALGLARSFATSTRFILDAEFARALFLRARYLLERFVEHEGKDWESFTLPSDVLVY
ncbi:MAG: hypothetical protein K8I02_06400, partial [Candidatus Methylomirabilis sp.]|nr:hypothetical protein [Deltaproteobacteria bacterium]